MDFDSEDEEVESIRIQLLEIEGMDEDDLTVEIMDNYNNLETRLWELTGGFEAETFEAPYVGSGALMDIGKNTDLSSFTTSELTKSSAIHGDFDTASLDYSGHQNIEVKAEGTFDAEYHYEPYWDYGAFAHTPCQAVIVFDIDDAGTSKENTGKCEECGENHNYQPDIMGYNTSRIQCRRNFTVQKR